MLDRDELRDLQRRIEALRDASDDALILSVGTIAGSYDGEDGFAEATVRMGDDIATARCKYLDGAISLARGKILRDREPKAKKKADEAKKVKATGGNHV